MIKKTILFLFIFLTFSTSAVFARSYNMDYEGEFYDTAEELIRDGVSQNYMQIKSISKNLSYDEKWDLYDRYSRSGGIFAGVNAASFWGIGSFVQGDYNSGVSICAVNFLASTVMAVGGIMLCCTTANAWSYLYTRDYDIGIYNMQLVYSPDYRLQTVSSVMLLAGGISLVANYIGGIYAPLNYAKRFNRSLAGALNLYDADVSAYPYYSYKSKTTGVALSMKLRF